MKEGEASDGKRRKGNSSRRRHTTGEKDQEGALGTIEHETADKGGINFIVSGFSSGGTTQSARKRYAKSIMAVESSEDSTVQEYPGITFEIQDFNGVLPHSDDPIVISVTTSGFRIARVLVDGGSSTNVIYGKCFDELKFPPSILQEYQGTLVGFSGEQVAVRVHLSMRTTFGEKENAKTVALQYMVVQA